MNGATRNLRREEFAPGLLTSLGFFWANWVNFLPSYILVSALIIRRVHLIDVQQRLSVLAVLA